MRMNANPPRIERKSDMSMPKLSPAEELSDLLSIANSFSIALVNTFSDDGQHTKMPPDRMHAALFGLQLVIERAKEIADKSP